MYDPLNNSYQQTYKMLKQAEYEWFTDFKNGLGASLQNPKAFLYNAGTAFKNTYNNKIAPTIEKGVYKVSKPIAAGVRKAFGEESQNYVKDVGQQTQKIVNDTVKGAMDTAKTTIDGYIKPYQDKFKNWANKAQGWIKNNSPWLGAAGGALGGALILPLIASMFTSNKKAKAAITLMGLLGTGYAGYHYGKKFKQ